MEKTDGLLPSPGHHHNVQPQSIEAASTPIEKKLQKVWVEELELDHPEWLVRTAHQPSQGLLLDWICGREFVPIKLDKDRIFSKDGKPVLVKGETVYVKTAYVAFRLGISRNVVEKAADQGRLDAMIASYEKAVYLTVSDDAKQHIDNQTEYSKYTKVLNNIQDFVMQNNYIEGFSRVPLSVEKDLKDTLKGALPMEQPDSTIALMRMSSAFSVQELKNLVKTVNTDPGKEKILITLVKIGHVFQRGGTNTYLSQDKEELGFHIDEKNNIYLQKEHIAEGSFKRVYAAVKLQDFSKFVFGVIKEVTGIKPQEEVDQEQRMQSRYQGKRGIIPCYKVTFEVDGTHGFIQERMDSDASKLSEKSMKTRLQVFCDVSCGIAVVNKDKHVHRDVKLENIAIKDGRGYLADFGLACTVETEIKAGAPFYVPPEIYEAGYKSNIYADSYALGVSILETIEPEKIDLYREVRAFAEQIAENPGRESELLLQFEELIVKLSPEQQKAVRRYLEASIISHRYSRAYDEINLMIEKINDPKNKKIQQVICDELNNFLAELNIKQRYNIITIINENLLERELRVGESFYRKAQAQALYDGMFGGAADKDTNLEGLSDEDRKAKRGMLKIAEQLMRVSYPGDKSNRDVPKRITCAKASRQLLALQQKITPNQP